MIRLVLNTQNCSKPIISIYKNKKKYIKICMYCIVEYVEDTQTFLSCPTFNSAPRRARSGPKIASFSLRFPLRPRGPSSSQASGAQVEQERLMLCSCLFMKNIKVPQRLSHPLLYALDKVILLSSTWARHPTPLPWYPESPSATRPSQSLCLRRVGRQ